MKNNWMKVFGFTFRKTAGGRGYLATTVIVALLLLAAVPAAMLISDSMQMKSDSVSLYEDEIEYEIEMSETPISRAVFVGVTEQELASAGNLGHAAFEYADSLDAAADDCEGDPGAVIVVCTENTVTVLLPDDCGVSMYEAAVFSDNIVAALSAPSGAADMEPNVVLTDTVPDELAAAEDDMVTEILGFVIPYVVVMLMYFTVLIYGQSVANSAIMEKTSKLMDLFLVSVKPTHMMLGKTLATAAAGLIQVLAWLFSAVGGCALGVWLVKSVNPDTTLAIIGVFESIGGYAAMFEPAVLATAALTIVAGFVVYCALAGIGGAIASKPEDLGSANYFFTFSLVISFFACLFTGDAPGMISDAVWIGYVPFTAVLVMPGRLLTGAAGVGQGLVSVGISAVAAVLLCAMAGKAYSAMAFYRGKPVKPLGLLKGLIKRV